MELVTIVSILALVEYMVFGALVGRARASSGVQAPATVGDPVFERYYRVQQNTLEQLVVFVPALWLFAIYVDGRAAAGLGLLFVLGRALYCRGYVQDPARRGTGFIITAIAQSILLAGSLVGAVVSLYVQYAGS